MMESWIFWLLVILILTFFEVVTFNLVSIWFIISGIAALLISFLTDSFIIQFSVFAVFGIVLLLLTSKFAKKITPKDEKVNLDRVIGMTGIVTEKITKNTVGEVKVDGKKWSAKADKVINIDEEVEIKDIEGVKLIVKKIERKDDK